MTGAPIVDLPRWLEPRVRYIALALGTIALGLVVHLHGSALSPTLRDILGDALWAAMATWWVAAITPATAVWLRAAIALAVCVAVEVSQLFHTPALDAVRHTMLGHLILGSGFDLRDFVAYAGGVLAATVIELGFLGKRLSKGQP